MDALRTLDPGRDDLTGLLALNNAYAAQLSRLDREAFRRLIGDAFLALSQDAAGALLVALDQDAPYDSPNFVWWKTRRDRFVYVDRIVVAPDRRGQGLARSLYETVFAHARAAGHARVVCEINFDPPNPVSEAFHIAMGFAPAGLARISPTKALCYWERLL